jgi:hypothetical protein
VSALASDPRFLPREKLESALEELRLGIESAEAKELLEIHAGAGIDLAAFQSVLQKESTVCEWAKALPFHAVFADAIPRKMGLDPLRVVSELSANEWVSVLQAVQHGLMRLLQESAALLKQAFLVSDARKQVDDGSKFNVNGMSCGDFKDFHAGIEGRVGMALVESCSL